MAAAVSNRPRLSTAGLLAGESGATQCLPQTAVWSSQSPHRFPAGNAPVPEGENTLFNGKIKTSRLLQYDLSVPQFLHIIL